MSCPSFLKDQQSEEFHKFMHKHRENKIVNYIVPFPTKLADICKVSKIQIT